MQQDQFSESSPSVQGLSRDVSCQVKGGTARAPDTGASAPFSYAEDPALTLEPKAPGPGASSLWSDSLQAVLNQPPSAFPKYLILGGFLFSCTFGFWAWVGRYQEVSLAEGRLVPQGNVYRVQAAVPGEIAHLLVKEGQTVQAGQTVIELDRRVAEAEVERLEQTLQALQSQVTQTQRLIDRTHSEMTTQRAIAAAEIQAQEASIAQARANVSTSQDIGYEIEKEINANQGRLDRLLPLVDKGALPEEYIFGVEASLRESERSQRENQGRLQQAEGQLEQSLAQLNQRRAEAQRQYEESQQRLQRLEIEIADLQAKVTDSQTLLASARTRLDQMNIYAPVDGIVSSLDLNNSGEVAQLGQTLIEIAPKDARLVMSAQLPSRDAGLVNPGMPVQIKLDSFPYQTYGIVSGEVLSVSPDTTTTVMNEVVYEVEIALDRNYVVHEGQTIPLKVGQTGSAEIVIRQKRIIDILLDPIRQLKKGGINL